MSCPELVVFGNLLLDDVVYDDGRTRMGQAGGAALYCALGARLWDVRVGIVSRIGNDYPTATLKRLSELGIDLAGVSCTDRADLRTWLLYEGELRRVVHRLGGPSHDDVSPSAEELPAAWRRAGAFHLAPMPFTVHRQLVAELGRFAGTRLSLDPYELLTEDRIAAWRRLVAGVDLFLFSEDEMEVQGGRSDPTTVLERLSAGGRLARILFKRGARGGLVFDVDRREATVWSACEAREVDVTGAGDAFAGGLLAGLVTGRSLSRALAMGAVSAAFAVGGEGADGLLAADPVAARGRLES